MHCWEHFFCFSKYYCLFWYQIYCMDCCCCRYVRQKDEDEDDDESDMEEQDV